MSAGANDWLMEQAAVSARFLTATPVDLLGPAGRALQAMAADWAAEPPELRVVSEPDSMAKPTTKSRGRRSSKNAGDGQMPLLHGMQPHASGCCLPGGSPVIPTCPQLAGRRRRVCPP